MKTIAILCGRYLPGFKDGGPVRTLINICECLGDEYNFKIITNDRDHGDTKPYPNISYTQPNRVGKADVWYLPPKGFTFRKIKELTKDVDLIYCFGPYDDYAYKAMILKRFRKLKQPLVVASMGSFSDGAIKIKNIKKKLFLNLCKIFGLFSNIVWSVTSDLEQNDVKKYIGKKADCCIAEDLPRNLPEIQAKKPSNILRIIFLSRICEKKNLLYAIKVLQKCSREVVFDIYGTLEDEDYWETCKKEMALLPVHIHWQYKGVVDTHNVINVFSEYDVFLFPTRGENYGHVIFESMAGGCIPIISDQTPWLDLETKDCGFVFPLKDADRFSRIIEMLTEEKCIRKSKNARAYAKKKYIESVRDTGYRKVFDL